MPLVPARCPNCGALLNLDETGKADICSYCNTAFIVEEAIQNFNTTYNVTNNVTNNIVADNVVLAQENPKYLEDLQRIKSSVNRKKELKDQGKKFTSFYDDPSIHIEYKAELYFDKEEYLYYYAILIYYDAYNIDFVYKDNELIERFECVLEKIKDPQKVESLNTYLSEMKKKRRTVEEVQEEYKQDFYKIFSRNPKYFDGLYIVGKEISPHYFEETVIFVYYNEQLYLLGKSSGDIHKISSFQDLLKFLSGRYYLENGWVKFTKPMSFEFETKEMLTTSRDTLNSMSLHISDKPISAGENGDYFSCNIPIGNSDHASKCYKYFGDYKDLKKDLEKIFILSAGRCLECGAPLNYKFLSKSLVCSVCKAKY